MNNSQTLEMVYLDSDRRTKIVKLHIYLTFIFKTLAIGLSYLLVPLTINYLNIEQYGIWMTLLSIMSWITFFDIGLGNGLRNKLTEALAVNDFELARTYVSTAYVAVSFIALVFFVILSIILPFAPWNKVFNTTSLSNTELQKVVFTIGFFFLLNFVLSLSNQMFYASQKASLVPLGLALQNLLYVSSIYILIRYTSGRLLYLCICYGLSMVLSNLMLLFYFFKKHSTLIPSPKHIDFTKIGELASLGVKFFIIQIAALIIFATDNMIITQILGPEHVTPYNVVFKLFSIVTIGHGMILAPLWSAYTDAYAKGDIVWIKKTLKKLNLLMIPIIIVVLILITFSKEIINIWVGDEIKVPNLLVLLMGVYTIISVWSNIYAYFVNGVGKISIQVYTAILGGLINIPLSIYFAKYLNMESSGVLLGTIISLSIFAVIGPIQTYNILYKQRIGIIKTGEDYG